MISVKEKPFPLKQCKAFMSEGLGKQCYRRGDSSEEFGDSANTRAMRIEVF